MAVDISRFQKTVLRDATQKAHTLQACGNFIAAAAAWDKASEHAEFYASITSSKAEKAHRLNTAKEYRATAAKLRELQQGAGRPEQNAKCLDQSDTDEFRTAARHLVHKSSITFDDIAGLETTTQEIQLALALAMAKAPQEVEIPQVKKILFYGPPGCGKTLLAAAVSNAIDGTFFSVKVPDLMSRYYGDSPKLVQALYEEARTHSKSVIFLDEFEALAAGRSEGHSSADRKLLVSFLTELDGLNEKDSDTEILTIAATNRPWELDDAILSRFEKTVYIPLPDEAARLPLIRHNLHQKGHEVQISEQDILRHTKGFSGREIAHLCKLMIEAMTNEANPEIMSVVAQGREAIRNYDIRILPISQKHFDMVRKQVHPRTSFESIEAYKRWSKSSNEMV